MQTKELEAKDDNNPSNGSSPTSATSKIDAVSKHLYS